MSAKGAGKATAGPWTVREGHGELCVYGPKPCRFTDLVIAERIGGINVQDGDGRWLKLEAQANARLIAEAGTVLHETGKTPRQLADEVERLTRECGSLLAALRGTVEELEAFEAPASPLDSHNVRLAEARAAIALTEQQQTAGERG